MVNASNFLIILPLLLAASSASAAAPPNHWPFDFDPALAEHPSTVSGMIDELAAGLDGLPEELMTEMTTGPVRLWFFQDIVDAFTRAGEAGPDFMPPPSRQPQICASHAAFEYPTLLAGFPSLSCVLTEMEITAAFDEMQNTCRHVEFPETYVFEHPPAYVDAVVVSTFDGLISFAGEALSHIQYPVGVLPDDFMAVTRRIIAKIRYDTLRNDINERLNGYQTALDLLQTEASCFDASGAATLTSSIEALVEELEVARAQLDDIRDTGLTQAALDRQAVEAMGRVRQENLLHPALTDRERELLAFYIGGVYWRMRGGGLVAAPGGTQAARTYFLLAPFRLIGELSGGQEAREAGYGIYRRIFDGWGIWMDMGRTAGDDDKYNDLVGMTNRGKQQVETARSYLEGEGYDVKPLGAGGLQMGPAYFWAWDELIDFNVGEQMPEPYDVFIEGPTAIGEFATGAAIALGLTKTLLWGKPDPSCVPACAGRDCGGDGCGGACGSCTDGAACEQGVCTCLAECGGRSCGDDGCGGSCGVCSADEVCVRGACECAPSCVGKSCGDDGCNSSCGDCNANETCTGGICQCTSECGDVVPSDTEPDAEACPGGVCSPNPDVVAGCDCSVANSRLGIIGVLCILFRLRRRIRATSPVALSK